MQMSIAWRVTERYPENGADAGAGGGNMQSGVVGAGEGEGSEWDEGRSCSGDVVS